MVFSFMQVVRKFQLCRAVDFYKAVSRWAVSHILDDFIILSHSKETCQCYLDSYMSLARFVGSPEKHSKTVSPATCVTVHGIEVDTELMGIRLPRDKLDDALNLVTRFARRKKLTLRELQSLIGTLKISLIRSLSRDAHFCVGSLI